MNKQLAVRLRLYRGSKSDISYNEKGTVKSENWANAYEYGSEIWRHAMANLLGEFGFATVESVSEKNKEGGYDQVTDEKTLSAIQKEVDTAFAPKQKALTPEQKKIADLEAQVQQLMNKSIPTTATNTTDELEAAKVEYKALFGQRPHNSRSLEQIKADIAAKQA